MAETTSGNSIELRVENISQLFHTLDPFPFRERDLDKEAEEFIVGWAREFVADRAIRIVVHFSRNRGANEGRTRVEGSLPSIFFRSRRCCSTRDQGAVSGWSPLARDRRHDPGGMSS